MSLDSRRGGATILLTPHEDDFRARISIVRIEHSQCQHLTLVRAVSDPRGDTDRLPVHDHPVEWVHRIDRRWPVDKLRPVVLLEGAADCARYILVVQRQRDLFAMSAVRYLLERFAADEVMIEFDKGAVAHIPRREIIVFDILRIEAAADRR